MDMEEGEVEEAEKVAEPKSIISKGPGKNHTSLSRSQWPSLSSNSSELPRPKRFIN